MKTFITFVIIAIIGLLFWIAYFNGVLFTIPTLVIGAVVIWCSKIILEVIHQ